MKKNGIALASLVLNLVLVVLVLWQGSRLDTQERNIRDVQNDLTDSLDQTAMEVSGLREDIREGERLVADWSLEPAGIDPETRSVLLNASVTLKEWNDDTDAALLLELDGQTTEAPLIHAGNGVFTGAAAVPVEGNGSLTVTLLADTGGIVSREQADYVHQLSELLPIASWSPGFAELYWEDGTLLLPSGFVFTAYDQAYNNIPVQQPAFRLYRNGTVIFEEAAVEIPVREDDPYCYYLRETNEDGLGETIPVDAQPGDELRLTFVCQDQFGLAYEFPFGCWQVYDSAVGTVHEDGDVFPALTWPE